jgi:hypothetical protein
MEGDCLDGDCEGVIVNTRVMKIPGTAFDNLHTCVDETRFKQRSSNLSCMPSFISIIHFVTGVGQWHSPCFVATLCAAFIRKEHAGWTGNAFRLIGVDSLKHVVSHSSTYLTESSYPVSLTELWILAGFA